MQTPSEWWNLLCRVGSVMPENVAETFLEYLLQDGQEIDVGATGESIKERLARLARQDRPVRVEGGS